MASSFTMTKHISAPPERVFELITDLERSAEYIRGIEKIEPLTDGPMGMGTKWRETRIMFKRQATEEMEVVDFQPGRSYTVLSESCGCESRWRMSVDEQDGGTLLSMDMKMKAITVFAKIMSPLGMLFAGTMKKCIDNDLDDIRAVAEGRAAGASPDAAPA